MITIKTKDRVMDAAAWRHEACYKAASAIPEGCLPFDSEDPDKMFIDAKREWQIVFDSTHPPGSFGLLNTGTDGAGKEFALALWLSHLNPKWSIVPKVDGNTRGRLVSVDVEFSVILPESTDPKLWPTISFEIPMEHVVTFIDSMPVPGARISSYKTSDIVEERMP